MWDTASRSLHSSKYSYGHTAAPELGVAGGYGSNLKRFIPEGRLSRYTSNFPPCPRPSTAQKKRKTHLVIKFDQRMIQEQIPLQFEYTHLHISLSGTRRKPYKSQYRSQIQGEDITYIRQFPPPQWCQSCIR